jgi:hypothetical protein
VKKKRWTVKLALCLLAGAVVTVLLAAWQWRAIDRVPELERPWSRIEEGYFVGGPKELPWRWVWRNGPGVSSGGARIGWQHLSWRHYPVEFQQRASLAWLAEIGIQNRTPPPLSGLQSARLDDTSGYAEFHSMAVGFPARCFRSVWSVDSGKLVYLDVFEGMAVQPDPESWWRNQRERVIPTRVLWGQFALNTLFYAAVLLGVAEGVAFARRRVRRGRCPSCGYDRAGLAEGSACPECGKGA